MHLYLSHYKTLLSKWWKDLSILIEPPIQYWIISNATGMSEGSWTERTNSTCTLRGLNAPGVQMEYSCSAVGCSAICLSMTTKASKVSCAAEKGRGNNYENTSSLSSSSLYYPRKQSNPDKANSQISWNIKWSFDGEERSLQHCNTGITNSAQTIQAKPHNTELCKLSYSISSSRSAQANHSWLTQELQ